MATEKKKKKNELLKPLELVALITSDGDKISVPKRILSRVGLLENVLRAPHSGSAQDGSSSNSSGSDSGSSSSSSSGEMTEAEAACSTVITAEVPIQLSTRVWKMVQHWLECHRDSPPVKISKPMSGAIYEMGVPTFDIKFLENGKTIPDIFDICSAAMYLQIPVLLDLCCAKLATLVKGKTPSEIYTTFGLKKKPQSSSPREALYRHFPATRNEVPSDQMSDAEFQARLQGLARPAPASENSVKKRN